MRTRRLSLRTYIVLVGCVMAGAAGVSCGDNPSPIRPSLVPPEVNNAGIRHESDGTNHPGGEAEVGPELAAVRRATAAFHDAEVAAASGYLFNEPCQESAAGAMGIHAPNPALVRSQLLDPARPELLLYLPKPGGGLRLVGVEYMHVVMLRNTVTGHVGPWVSSSPWPATYEVVTPTPQLFGQTFEGPMPGHTSTMPWHWDLHVWLWAHNPAGMFAQWNSALQCAG